MTMKKILKSKRFLLIVVALLVLFFVPSLITRVTNEQANRNVVVSLQYGDIVDNFSEEELDNVLQDYQDIGVTSITVSEKDVYTMAARGEVTNIKYSVLCHKYDEESLELADIIANEAPATSADSQLLITKNEKVADFVRKGLSERLGKDEFAELDNGKGLTVFSIYDGNQGTSEMILGYDEEEIAELYGRGFDICLSIRMQDNTKTEYLDTLEELIEKYDVKYLAIRSSAKKLSDETDAKEHYERISEIIDNNDMTLVIKEAATQLSNDEPYGYDIIFDENSDKVLRSYESASVYEAGEYMKRYQEYFNSTLDRNIRFISVSQIYRINISHQTLHEQTIEVTETYINKIKELGYTVNSGEVTVFDYDVDLTLIDAVAAALMVLLAYLMFVLVTNYENHKLTFAALALAVLCIPITFVMPDKLLALYPTVWSVVMPCFGITVVFAFVKHFKDKMGTILMAVLAPVIVAGVMSIGGIVMTSLLSGIDYYVNNDIFYGVKLSLLVPVVYGVLIYYWMFGRGEKSVFSDIKKVLMSDIKVYWIVIAGIIGVVGMVYIIRSGNVNSISSIETAMRNFLSEHFVARPRTKEFLVAYPCLVLFVYYIKNTDIKLIQAIFAAGSTILAASISNSFCHVFTDAEIIYMRVVNGLLIGAIVSVAAYILNLLLVKLIKYISGLMKNMDI